MVSVFVGIRKVQAGLRAGRERVTAHHDPYEPTRPSPRSLRVLKFPVLVRSEGKDCSGNPVNRHEIFPHGQDQAENPRRVRTQTR